MAPDALRRAVFLDRDGTLVEDPGFLHEPHRVALLPAAGPALRRLAAAGLVLVTVSNQSGIARGRYRIEDYQAVQERLGELLAAHGARLDASYFCPHHPDVDGPCACRKPGTALFEAAARELGLDLAGSWWIGDRLSDVVPARRFGGRGVLVETGHGRAERVTAQTLGFPVAADLQQAVEEHVLRYLAVP